MDEEIDAMERTNTWSILPLLHGTIDQHNAHLVAKGYSQQ